MSINIAEFVKRLVPSLSRSDIETDLSISLESIQSIIDTCTNLSEIDKVAKLNSPKAVSIVKDFYAEFNKSGRHKVKIGKKFPDDMITLMHNLRTNGEAIRKEVEDISNEVIVTHAMSTFKANIIRAVGHYYFMTRYATDLLNYIYVKEAEHGGVEFTTEGQLKKTQLDFIEKSLWIFARLISVYGDTPDQLHERMKDLTDALLPKDSVDEVVEVYSVNQLDLVSGLPSGFVGWPIYSVRLVFAQWEADRYRHMKDKKRLLELRLLHLKMLKENGQADLQMERELTALQKSVTDLDYKITKIEEDVNG